MTGVGASLPVVPAALPTDEGMHMIRRYMHAYFFVRMCVCFYMHVCVRMCVCTCVYDMYVCTYIYTYIDIPALHCTICEVIKVRIGMYGVHAHSVQLNCGVSRGSTHLTPIIYIYILSTL